jgi:hypothetical protein
MVSFYSFRSSFVIEEFGQITDASALEVAEKLITLSKRASWTFNMGRTFLQCAEVKGRVPLAASN